MQKSALLVEQLLPNQLFKVLTGNHYQPAAIYPSQAQTRFAVAGPPRSAQSMASVACGFTTQLRDEYQRNNKDTGQKNLRCFPDCDQARKHVAHGFCGTVVDIWIREYRRHAKLHAWAIFAEASDRTNDVQINSIMKLADIKADKERGRGNPSRPWIPADRTPAGFQFNRSRQGWHYGWVSSVHTSSHLHVMRAFIFEEIPDTNGLVRCVGATESTPFRIFCSRRRQRAAAQREASAETASRGTSMAKTFSSVYETSKQPIPPSAPLGGPPLALGATGASAATGLSASTSLFQRNDLRRLSSLSASRLSTASSSSSSSSPSPPPQHSELLLSGSPQAQPPEMAVGEPMTQRAISAPVFAGSGAGQRSLKRSVSSGLSASSSASSIVADTTSHKRPRTAQPHHEKMKLEHQRQPHLPPAAIIEALKGSNEATPDLSKIDILGLLNAHMQQQQQQSHQNQQHQQHQQHQQQQQQLQEHIQTQVQAQLLWQQLQTQQGFDPSASARLQGNPLLNNAAVGPSEQNSLWLQQQQQQLQQQQQQRLQSQQQQQQIQQQIQQQQQQQAMQFVSSGVDVSRAFAAATTTSRSLGSWPAGILQSNSQLLQQSSVRQSPASRRASALLPQEEPLHDLQRSHAEHQTQVPAASLTMNMQASVPKLSGSGSSAQPSVPEVSAADEPESKSRHSGKPRLFQPGLGGSVGARFAGSAAFGKLGGSGNNYSNNDDDDKDN